MQTDLLVFVCLYFCLSIQASMTLSTRVQCLKHGPDTFLLSSCCIFSNFLISSLSTLTAVRILADISAISFVPLPSLMSSSRSSSVCAKISTTRTTYPESHTSLTRLISVEIYFFWLVKSSSLSPSDWPFFTGEHAICIKVRRLIASGSVVMAGVDRTWRWTPKKEGPQNSKRVKNALLRRVNVWWLSWCMQCNLCTFLYLHIVYCCECQMADSSFLRAALTFILAFTFTTGSGFNASSWDARSGRHILSTLAWSSSIDSIGSCKRLFSRFHQWLVAVLKGERSCRSSETKRSVSFVWFSTIDSNWAMRHWGSKGSGWVVDEPWSVTSTGEDVGVENDRRASHKILMIVRSIAVRIEVRNTRSGGSAVGFTGAVSRRKGEGVLDLVTILRGFVVVVASVCWVDTSGVVEGRLATFRGGGWDMRAEAVSWSIDADFEGSRVVGRAGDRGEETDRCLLVTCGASVISVCSSSIVWVLATVMLSLSESWPRVLLLYPSPNTSAALSSSVRSFQTLTIVTYADSRFMKLVRKYLIFGWVWFLSWVNELWVLPWHVTSWSVWHWVLRMRYFVFRCWLYPRRRLLTFGMISLSCLSVLYTAAFRIGSSRSTVTSWCEGLHSWPIQIPVLENIHFLSLRNISHAPTFPVVVRTNNHRLVGLVRVLIWRAHGNLGSLLMMQGAERVKGGGTFVFAIWDWRKRKAELKKGDKERK